ncbi:MAG: VWA domain-containing protein [Natronospirillum sp.]|uniref:VWA domain-containing protein n=1 Tax=Natronospirillum sp. TaxID=2812955 RepID=UPI0025E5D4C2|nr:VWA domain-containing protein [Natronospirillum sp.]MCH8550629.1 VWA domain-containing protein [Natronospirillum sp.]
MPDLSALTFARPWLILLLPLALLVWWRLPAGVRSAPRVPFADAWRAAADTRVLSGLLHWRGVLMLLAWLLLVLAVMRPQVPGDRDNILLTGRQMMLLVDLSLSMSIPDMRVDGQETDRLTAVKAILEDFIPDREGDQIGLIVFGSQAYVHVPVTPDLATVARLADEMEIGMAGPRTALGEALALGVIHLAETRTARAGDEQVMILLSDGAQTIGSVFPREAGILARDRNITIHTIGFGTEDGGPLGSPSDIDEPALIAIAETTGGEYFRAQSSEDLLAIYRTIDQLEPVEANERYIRHARDVWHWPAGLALMLILVSALPAALVIRRPGVRS